MRRILRRYIGRRGRRLPLILVIHVGGVLYRLGCHALGWVPGSPMSRPGGRRPDGDVARDRWHGLRRLIRAAS